MIDDIINNEQANESKASLIEIELYDKHTGSLIFKERLVDQLSKAPPKDSEKGSVYKSDYRHVMHHFFFVSIALLRELSLLIPYLGSNGKNSKGFLDLLDEISLSKTEIDDRDRENFFKELAEKAQYNRVGYINSPKGTPWMVDRIGTDQMRSRVNLIPQEILNFLMKNSIISEEYLSDVLDSLVSPLIKELLMNRKIYELAVLAAIAHDGLPILTSHRWVIKLSGSTEERKEVFEKFRDILNNLAKGSKWIQRRGDTYSTNEIDGLFLLGKDILEDIDHLSFLSEENLWNKGCDSVVVLLEVTMKRSHKKDELGELLKELKDKVDFVKTALTMISGYYHVAGVLVVRKEIKKEIYDKLKDELKEIPRDDAPILVESIENMFSQDGRVKLYSSVIDKITKMIDKSDKSEFPTFPF